MVDLIAFKDASVRNLYRLETASTKPTSLSAAVKVLKDILISNVRAEEIYLAAHGAQPALAAAKARAPAQPQATDGATTLLAALAAVLSKVAQPDPNNEQGVWAG